MRRKLVSGALLAALAATGCTTLPADYADSGSAVPPPTPPVRTNQPVAAQDYPPPVRIARADQRDTPAVNAARDLPITKPRWPEESAFPRFDPTMAYARFDDAVAVSEAIGDSPPDYAFRLLGSEAWAWVDPSGEMLIVEGNGPETIQYFFGARDDYPQFIRTGTYGHAFASGRLIGTFYSNGAPVADRVFNTTAESAEQWLIRGRALFHAAEDRRWDRDTARRWTAVQPVYGGWVTSWVAPPVWAGDYGRYRERPESRERRERRRLTREQRRERSERFTRWRNGGGVGTPPGDGDPAITPARPTNPGGPTRPARPPRDDRTPAPTPPPPPASPPTPPPPLAPAPGPLAPVNPAEGRPEPEPQRPTSVEPRLRRNAPGWLGRANDQPLTAEPETEAPTIDGDAVDRQRRDAEAAERTRRMQAAAAEAAAEQARRNAEAAAQAAEQREAETQSRAAAEAEERAAARAAAERAAAERAAAERAAEQQAAAARAAAERAAAEAAAPPQPRVNDDGAVERGPD